MKVEMWWGKRTKKGMELFTVNPQNTKLKGMNVSNDFLRQWMKFKKQQGIMVRVIGVK